MRLSASGLIASTGSAPRRSMFTPLVHVHTSGPCSQVALLDAPWIFKGIWSMFTPLLDEIMQMKVMATDCH